MIHFELNNNQKHLKTTLLEEGFGVWMTNEFCIELSERSFEGLPPNCESLLIIFPSKLDSLIFCTMRDFFGSKVRKLSQT